MNDQYIRTRMIAGDEMMAKLAASRVAVFGLGGVGGNVLEGLARSGIGTLDLIDHDTVDFSNLNRQIIALHSTLGKYKTEAAEARVHDIDPAIRVNKHCCFYLPSERDRFDFQSYDYVVDAIDTVSAKIDLIMACKEAGTPVISAMGCGNRFDPLKLTVTDIYKTKGDPLAKIMRHELKKRGVDHLKVVYSNEPPIKPIRDFVPEGKERVPGSSPFVPTTAGLLIAAEVVRDLTKSTKRL